MVEEAIKQMKRLQNLGTMDDDRIDMEDIEHQGEDEDMTNIENNPSKKEKEEKIKNMLIKVMAIYKLLAKKLFQSSLEKIGSSTFPNTLDYGSNCGE